MKIMDWVATAQRGDSFEYARGNLAFARGERARLRSADLPTSLYDRDCDEGEDAWRLYEAGKVLLVQRRIAKDAVAYEARRL